MKTAGSESLIRFKNRFLRAREVAYLDTAAEGLPPDTGAEALPPILKQRSTGSRP